MNDNCEKERREYELAAKELEQLEDEIANIPAQPVPPGGQTPPKIDEGLVEKALAARELKEKARVALEKCDGRK